MSAETFELGLNSFGDVPTDGGRVLSDAETLRLLVREAQLAESVGLDVFSVGEHYREGYVDSATPVTVTRTSWIGASGGPTKSWVDSAEITCMPKACHPVVESSLS